ncbi:MAG: DegT/DnrJ/EryC1/StrS family aminotransferase, partial [Rhizobacter sp.]|nr:DegT/DnrJ/EryC1/StrS family aminotransferase [Rhizobacter sp.]
ARLDRFVEIARRHGVALIEDCSHAHGALFGGRPVGTWGDIGCFSLQGNKPVSGGEADAAAAVGGRRRFRSSVSKRAATLSVSGVVARMALPSLANGLLLIWPLSAQCAACAEASALPWILMLSGCNDGSCN